MLAGKPLIYWTLKAAFESKLVTRVVVSTDSQAIANLAALEGAEVPFLRSPALSQDTTPMLPVIIDVLEQLGTYRPDYVVLLQATSPLRTPEDIDQAIQLLLDSPLADSVVSCQKIPHQLHPEKTFGRSGLGFVEFLQVSSHEPGTQLYARNGPAVLVSKVQTLERGSLFGDNSLAFEMPGERSIDIDTELDFFIAEKIMEVRLGSPNNAN
jgi:CMP-N-acetylneuraminic acid synthetase